MRKVTLCVLLVFLSACSVGPHMIPGNRLDYNVTLQQSNNEELLVNLVRAKYYEHPFFLQVGSIASQFSFSANAGLNVAIQRGIVPGATTAAETFTPSLGAGVQENPTVTYVPVQGAENVRKLLVECSLNVFALFSRATVPIDVLMRLLVRRIGPLDASPIQKLDAPGGAETGYDRFLALAALLKRLQDRGSLEVITPKAEPGEMESVLMVMSFSNAAERQSVERLMGIGERQRELQPSLRLIVRLVPVADLSLPQDKPKAEPVVPIRLRSLIEVLYFLAWSVEVPQEDLAKGVARRHVSAAGKVSDLRPLTRDLLDVRSASRVPGDSYAAVFYRGRWYYISDSDLGSKEVLSILAALYDLQSKEVERLQPILTLPVSK